MKGKGVAPPQPALAQMLFAAVSEHEAALGRVSRLLHDDVSQVLSAVGLQLDAMRMDFRAEAPGIEERAAEIQNMLEQVIEQLRDISNELNPSVVERAGLQFALDRLAGKVRKTFSGKVRLHFDSATHVPTAMAKTFYKIAECAVDNALARPGCTMIEIQIKRARGECVLEVHDNGHPDTADPITVSLGQMLMDYYATKNDVFLKVKESQEEGTVVRASYPLSGSLPRGAQ
ncbi:MAG TPA: histidine kinase [Bryobacteraceae bacterium]|jgi:signal transduction histidine kinase|nr:histidine kinase [Bryobacteraceae bacterium]